jgi:hypothetical protein
MDVRGLLRSPFRFKFSNESAGIYTVQYVEIVWTVWNQRANRLSLPKSEAGLSIMHLVDLLTDL